jgi:hypothetical protein
MPTTIRRALLPAVLLGGAALTPSGRESAWSALAFMAIYLAWVTEIRGDEDGAMEPPLRSDTATAIVFGALWLGREGIGGAVWIAAIAAALTRTWLARAGQRGAALKASFRASAPTGPCAVTLVDPGPDVTRVTEALSRLLGLDAPQVAALLRQLPAVVSDRPLETTLALRLADDLIRLGATCAVRPAEPPAGA